MMLFNPENPVILAIYRQGVFHFDVLSSALGVGRWAFKGGVKRRPDEQTLVPPLLTVKDKKKNLRNLCKSVDKTRKRKTRCCGRGRPRSRLSAPLFTGNA